MQFLDDTETIWLNNSKKRVFVRYRRLLPKSHTYRQTRSHFDGTKEIQEAPRHFDGEHVYTQVKQVKDLPTANGKIVD
jgi:hypothetical protein